MRVSTKMIVELLLTNTTSLKYSPATVRKRTVWLTNTTAVFFSKDTKKMSHNTHWGLDKVILSLSTWPTAQYQLQILERQGEKSVRLTSHLRSSSLLIQSALSSPLQRGPEFFPSQAPTLRGVFRVEDTNDTRDSLSLNGQLANQVGVTLFH